MRTLILLAVLPATILAGCSRHAGDPSGKTDDKPAEDHAVAGLPAPPSFPAPENGAGDSADPSGPAPASLLKPGLWDTTLTFNSVKAIGEDVGTGTDAFGNIPLSASAPRKARVCISADDARKGAPGMMSGSGLSSCTWKKLDTSPGTITGSLACSQSANQAELNADVTGALLPNLFGTQLHMTIGNPNGAHLVGEAMMQGERVGECTNGAMP